MSKPFWDLDEKNNYVQVPSLLYKTKYNIIVAYRNKAKTVEIFTYIDNLIRKLSRAIKYRLKNMTPRLRAGFKIFTDIHPLKHKLFELPIESMFRGLNKPKYVHLNYDITPVGKDGRLRARERFVFFKIRNVNGKFLSVPEITELVIHEISHTAANHVKWRDDDHNSDYYAYYNYLMNLV